MPLAGATSTWAVLATVGQLSQASPRPSASGSFWAGLGVVGQLSKALRTPSPSTSPLGSVRPSQTSPTPLAGLTSV